jgi:folate-dependent phosphoribosylglycinamide formyltransferase PurN
MIIGIFGYDFIHPKTTEILKNTVLNGFKVGAVFLAPKMNYSNDGKILSIDNSQVNNEARDFCTKNSIQVLRTKHDNQDLISSIILNKDIDLGLIGGARLIPGSIIDLFRKGIINYHPGKIPETSGLDSLYWSIKKNIPVFVTAHLIDEKVDAGFFIFESRVKILIKDSEQVIRKRIMKKQLELNHLVLKGIEEKTFDLKKIDRPQKNKRLSSQEIKQIMKRFERWKNFISIEA